jgi:hypothetical protein
MSTTEPESFDDAETDDAIDAGDTEPEPEDVEPEDDKPE